MVNMLEATRRAHTQQTAKGWLISSERSRQSDHPRAVAQRSNKRQTTRHTTGPVIHDQEQQKRPLRDRTRAAIARGAEMVFDSEAVEEHDAS